MLIKISILLLFVSSISAEIVEKSVLFTKEELVIDPGVCPGTGLCNDYAPVADETGILGYDADIVLARMSLDTGKISDVSRITRLRIHPFIRFSSVSALNTRTGIFYYIPTPERYAIDGTLDSVATSDRYSILNNAGKNQLFQIDVFNGYVISSVQLATNGTVQVLAADSTRNILTAIIDGVCYQVNVNTGVLTKMTQVFLNQRGYQYYTPAYAVSAMDTGNGYLYVVGRRYDTSPIVSYCDYVFRVNYLYGDLWMSDCINSKVTDIQFDQKSQILYAVLTPNDGSTGPVVVQMDPTSGNYIVQAQFPPSTSSTGPPPPPERAGVFDPETHFYYTFQLASQSDVSAALSSSSAAQSTLIASTQWQYLSLGLDFRGHYATSTITNTNFPDGASVIPGSFWVDTLSSAVAVIIYNMRSVSSTSGSTRLFFASREILRRYAAGDMFGGLEGANLQFIDFPIDRWIDRSDGCGGNRYNSCYGNIHFYVSKNATWTPSKIYRCPPGERWLSSCEMASLMNNACLEPAYYSVCGWSGSVYLGNTKTIFRFSDSWLNMAGLNAAVALNSSALGTFSSPSNFAGVACTTDFSQTLKASSWMSRSDSCTGFRQSECFPQVRFAVSQSNKWMKNVEYQCPVGYRAMTSCEATSIFVGCYVQTYTNALCGGSFSPNQQFFRFADSVSTGLQLDATLYQTSPSVSFSENLFAGMVCILNDPQNVPHGPEGVWADGEYQLA